MGEFRDDEFRDDEFTDDELTALALAADPEPQLDDDAMPFGVLAGDDLLLPEWYMPLSGPIRRTRPRALAVGVIVAAMLLVNAGGLCVTYGLPEIAW